MLLGKYLFNLCICFSDDFTGNTKLFLANSIYFKGEWETKFNRKLSKAGCFKTVGNDCQMTTFMNGKLNIKYAQVSDLNSQVVEIPFKVNYLG